MSYGQQIWDALRGQDPVEATGETPSSDTDYDFIEIEGPSDNRMLRGAAYSVVETGGDHAVEYVVLTSNVPNDRRDAPDPSSSHWDEWTNNPVSVGAGSGDADSFQRGVQAVALGTRLAAGGEDPVLDKTLGEVSA